ncbi:hypothetical protein IV203_010226 [Nitzschia inconspicua]|uniref:Uncharacterized protein n=1 Tax=Nitzschia inconspicua TaxID=303405 RepID=A0A9K3KX78_9STRA|nr:hypothetical protein IV203_010226 [Nitzschia inconspicua]
MTTTIRTHGQRRTVRARFRILLSMVTINLMSGWIPIVAALSNRDPPVTVKVCQNKHCCKRASKNVDVLQTMSNFFHDDDIRVVESSCLSHCDMGPNIQIDLPNGTSKLLHHMTDAQTCALQLAALLANEQEDSVERSKLAPPKVLVAASKVMEQSQTLPLTEQIRYLSSVISKLETSDLQQTAANAHAHALRAQAYVEQGKSEIAIHDAQHVVRELADVATSTTLTVAYRTWVDAEQQQQHFHDAVTILQEWYHAQPTYRTKLQKEIESLAQRL